MKRCYHHYDITTRSNKVSGRYYIHNDLSAIIFKICLRYFNNKIDNKLFCVLSLLKLNNICNLSCYTDELAAVSHNNNILSAFIFVRNLNGVHNIMAQIQFVKCDFVIYHTYYGLYTLLLKIVYISTMFDI